MTDRATTLEIGIRAAMDHHLIAKKQFDQLIKAEMTKPHAEQSAQVLDGLTKLKQYHMDRYGFFTDLLR